MDTVQTAVVALTALACTAIGVADLARARFVLENSAAVGVPPRWIPLLGLAKIAGGIGLLVGLAWWSSLGVAAGVGLVLFFLGAVAAHVRVRVFGNIAVPALFLAGAVASTALVAA